MNRTALPRAVYPGAMLAETVDIRRAEDRFARRSTNVPVTVMPATEVIAKYHDLWHVEVVSDCPNPTSTPGPSSTACATPSRAHLTTVFAAWPSLTPSSRAPTIHHDRQWSARRGDVPARPRDRSAHSVSVARAGGGCRRHFPRGGVSHAVVREARAARHPRINLPFRRVSGFVTLAHRKP